MWKPADSHTSDMDVCHDLSHSIPQSSFPPVVAQDSPRSSTNNTTTTTTTTTDLSTVQTSSQTSLSGSSTAFLASRSEVRFALETNFALQSALLSIEPAGAAAPQQPTATPAHDIHFSPPSLNPDQSLFCRDNDDDGAEMPRKPQIPLNVRFSSNPNECCRLREVQLPTRPDRCEDDGGSIPLQGQYVDVFAAAADDDADLLLLDDDDDGDYGDLVSDPPPPAADCDDDLTTSVRRFAWSYARGLSALVMGQFASGTTPSRGGAGVGRSVLVGGK